MRKKHSGLLHVSGDAGQSVEPTSSNRTKHAVVMGCRFLQHLLVNPRELSMCYDEGRKRFSILK